MSRNLALLLFALCHVQMTCAQTNVSPRDYGAGFRRLHQFGLPDVTGTPYGKVIFSMPDGQWRDRRDLPRYDILPFGLSGNAWKVKDLGGGTNRYVSFVADVVDAMDKDAYTILKKHTLAKSAGEPAGRRLQIVESREPKGVLARWRPADIENDALRILAGLDKPDESFMSSLEYGSGPCDALLLTAAQFYRLGYTNEANQIADRLFTLCPDGRALVKDCVGLIAEHEYGNVYRAFADTGNWEGWCQVLTNMLDRFSANWSKARGVKKLARLIKARIENPGLPVLEGEGVSEEDQTLARRLALEPETSRNTCPYFFSAWLFLVDASASRPDPGTNDVMTSIVVRRMKSAPMLIAMLKDNVLVHHSRSREADEPRFDYREEMPEDVAFNSIIRPSTRGEIARLLLQPIILLNSRQQNALRRMNVEDFAAECEAWYKEHKDRTLEELAKVYLENGDHSQRDDALDYLMQGGRLARNRVEVERILLGLARDEKEPPDILLRYVRHRKGRASDFVERAAMVVLGTNVAAKRTDSAQGGHPTGVERTRMVEDARVQLIKQLRNAVRVRHVKTLVDEFISSTQLVDEVYDTLRQQLSHENPHKSLDTLMEGVKRCDDPKGKVALLELLDCLPHTRGEDEDADLDKEGENAVVAAAIKFDPAKYADQLKTLMEHRRGGAEAVRVAAAWAVESLYGSREEEVLAHERIGACYECSRGDCHRRHSPKQIVDFLGDQGVDMLVERARAILEGKPVRKFPNSDNVDKQQREKLFSDMTMASDVGAVFAKLTLDQQLALEEMGITNRLLSAKLRPLGDRIVDVVVEGEFAHAVGLASKFKGRSLDSATLRSMLEVAGELAEEGCEFSFSVKRLSNVGGMKMLLRCGHVYSYEGAEPRLRTREANTNRFVFTGITGSLRSGRRFASARWSLAETKISRVQSLERWNDTRTPAPAENAGTGVFGPVTRKGMNVATRMMDEMEVEIRVIEERLKRKAQDGFWEEVDLFLGRVGAYAVTEVKFSGFGEVDALKEQ